MTIVPVYAGVLALAYLYLSYRVIALRRSRKVAIGAQGDSRIERAMRVHANFAEYAPFALLLLFMIETKGAPAIWLHGLCVVLVAGRALHAYGVAQEKEDFRFRVAGMMATLSVIGAAALSLIWSAVLG